jgi:protoheme IX farnesyltransferase
VDAEVTALRTRAPSVASSGAGANPSAPARARWSDYLTLTKPAITLLVVSVAVAGFAVALPPGSIPFLRLGELVGFGAMASGGAAALNHYFDRDLDARMRRTRHRPLPEARIVSPSRVLAIGLGLSVLGIGGAAVALNALTSVSILLGTITYVVVYTLWLKRRSSWNIVIGGFAGSAPALAGSAAAVGTWTPAALALALLVFLWTPPHFWSLALLLRDDYRRAGLPMLPRMDDPGRSARWVVVSTALLLPASVLLGPLGAAGPAAFVAILALGALFLALTAPLWKAPVRSAARRGFLYSGFYLLGVLLALIAQDWVSPAVRAIGPSVGL